MRFQLRPLVAACLALAAGSSLVGCGKKSPPAMPQMPVEVKAVTVEPSSTITYADKVGEVRSSQEVDLRARVVGYADLYRAIGGGGQ